MSEKNKGTGKVLRFERPLKQDAPATTAAFELKELLIIYDQLIALLRESYDEGLDALTDSIVVSVVRCRAALEKGMDEKASGVMVKEMREGLRQIPATLRSLLPGIGPRLSESLERKLGIQFSSC